MPLHLSYRPTTLEEVEGNNHIKDSLKTVLEREDRPHAYLFHGLSGTGKTTIARIIATMLGCSENDLYEFNISNLRGIDAVREIAQTCHYAGIVSKVRVYILDECHRQTVDAQSALLKLLEEPPKHVYFILCTTEPEKLLKTIHTRCTTYQTKLLNNKEMNSLIKRVLEAEGVKDFPKKITDEIIRVSEGCPRQALVTLDAVIDIEDDDKALEAVSVVTIGEAEVIEICRGIINNESWSTMRIKVKNVLQDNEPEKIRYAVLGYLSAILLNSNAGDGRVSSLIDLFSENTYASGKAGLINAIYLSRK